MKRVQVWLLVLHAFLSAGMARADIIVTDRMEVYEGTGLQVTETEATLRLASGEVVTVPIASVAETARGVDLAGYITGKVHALEAEDASPEEVVQQRLHLGELALRNRARELADQQWRAVLALDPGNHRAGRMLRYVLRDGRYYPPGEAPTSRQDPRKPALRHLVALSVEERVDGVSRRVWAEQADVADQYGHDEGLSVLKNFLWQRGFDLPGKSDPTDQAPYRAELTVDLKEGETVTYHGIASTYNFSCTASLRILRTSDGKVLATWTGTGKRGDLKRGEAALKTAMDACRGMLEDPALLKLPVWRQEGLTERKPGTPGEKEK